MRCTSFCIFLAEINDVEDPRLELIGVVFESYAFQFFNLLNRLGNGFEFVLVHLDILEIGKFVQDVVGNKLQLISYN